MSSPQSVGGPRVVEHPPQGLPLGFMPEPAYATPMTISLAPGDVFLLLTDGFFEWTNRAGEPVSYTHLRAHET